MYGNEEANYTMNRAAYGEVPAAMMNGGYGHGHGAGGMQNMMSDVGRVVMPVMYAAPARSMVGYYGQYQQQSGFFGSMAGTFGFATVPRSTTFAQHGYNAAGDFGERVGGGISGGLIALGGLGLTSAFSASGIGGGIGAGVGSLVGMSPVGAAVGAFALPVAAAMYTASAVTNAVQERRGIQSFLEQTSQRYVGAGSSMADPFMGGGMNREARAGMSEFMRGMDIKDKNFNMGDLTNILQQGTQMGMFSGTRDAEDFKGKFKQLTENLKVVTKVLNETLQDGMKTMADLRAVGIQGGAVQGAVMQADALGKVAGRTGQEMIGLGLQGAEMFRGTGVTMGIGFQSSQMNLAAVRASRDFGTLSQEAIAQAGGEESLALRMTASGLAFGQSQQGRGFGAAFVGPGGNLNSQAFMANVMGKGDFISTAMAGARNLSSPGKLIEYQANQEKFMSELGSQMGGQGLYWAQVTSASQYGEYMANAIGDKSQAKNFMNLNLKSLGWGTSQRDALEAQLKDPEKMRAAMMAGVAATTSKMKIEEAMQNAIWNRTGAAIGDFVKPMWDVAARPASQLIDTVQGGMQTMWREQVLGAISVDTSNIASKSYSGYQGRAGPLDITAGGGLGGKTAANAFRDLAKKDPGFLKRIGVNIKRKKTEFDGAITDSDAVIFDKDMILGDSYFSEKEGQAALKKANLLSMSFEDAKRMDTSGQLADVKPIKTIQQLALTNKKFTDTDDIHMSMYGTKDVTAEQRARAMRDVEGTSLAKLYKSDRTGANRFLDTMESVNTTKLYLAKKEYDKGLEEISKDAGFNISNKEVVAKLADAHEALLAGKSTSTLIGEIAVLQAKSSGETLDPGVAAAGIYKALSNYDSMKKIKGAMTTVSKTHSLIGASNISNIIHQDLTGDKGNSLSREERGMINILGGQLGTATTPAKLEEIMANKDAVAAATKLNPSLIGSYTDINNLKDIVGGERDEIEIARKLFQKGGILKSNATELAKMVSGGNISGAQQTALDLMNTTYSSQQQTATGSGAGATSGDSEVKTASEIGRTQVSMFNTIQHALEAVATRLGAK